MARRASRTGTWRWTAPRPRQRQVRAPKPERRTTRQQAAPREHRKPTAVEIAARVDFRSIERTLDDHLDALVRLWRKVRKEQMNEIAAQIRAAGGSPAALASIAAGPRGGDLILGHLRTVARQAGVGALREAHAQGVDIQNPPTETLESLLVARAQGTSLLLARALSETAARKASQYANPIFTPDSVAAAVSAHIEGLSDAWLRDQLNGALVGAQNTARTTVWSGVSDVPVRYIHSALLDRATCGPCAEADGRDYPSLAALEAAFPAHGYLACLGSTRCRCMGVAIFNEA